MNKTYIINKLSEAMIQVTTDNIVDFNKTMQSILEHINIVNVVNKDIINTDIDVDLLKDSIKCGLQWGNKSQKMGISEIVSIINEDMPELNVAQHKELIMKTLKEGGYHRATGVSKINNEETYFAKKHTGFASNSNSKKLEQFT